MNSCKCGCGTPIAQNKSFVSGHNGKGSRKPRVSVECRHCKKAFSGTANFMKTRIYCSNECRDAYRKEHTGSAHPSYTSFEMPCDICGKIFITQPARLKNHQVYCSMACGKEGRRRKISGVARNINPTGKQKAKVRDNFSCRICGFDLAVHAHHIVHRKNGGTTAIENLITLCPNHHALAHAGLLDSKAMIQAINSNPPTEKALRVRAKHAINYRE